MSLLNPAQRNSVLASARHLDDLLVEALRILREPRGDAPFSRHVPDAAPVQVRVIEDSIGRFRGALLRVLDELGVERPAPRMSARHSARVHLLYAEVALEELRPGRLRGYGRVAPEAASEIEGAVAELRVLVRRMSELLGEGPGGDLADRLDRLGDDGAVLSRVREIERVVTTRGLVELRPALGRLVERLEAPSLEMGVFGRVSSGKSSLLNRFLGRELLPVGVTPVTALPVRIAYGEEPRLRVTTVDGKATLEPLERLPAYATEAENPGNSKRVARLAVAVPSPRLGEGVTLVDTPGVGSLAMEGAEETRAYLPRCDLGVVLVDAGSTLTPEDLAITQALLAAGARTQVLLSKADALSPDDREEMTRYVARHLREELGAEVEVHPVSVVGAEVGLADAWFDERLAPLLARHRELTTASLAAKAEALSRATSRALRGRLLDGGPADEVGRAVPPHPAGDPEAPSAAAHRQALRLLDAARWELQDHVRDAGRTEGAVVVEAAGEIGRRWREEGFRPDLPAEALAGALRAWAKRVAEVLVAGLDELRERLAGALARGAGEASEAAPDPREGLPRPPAVPVFDPEPACRGLALDRPWLLGLSRALLSRWALARLEEHAGRAVDEALGFYRRLLVEWSERAVSDLRKAFEAQTAERGLDAAPGGLPGPLPPEEREALEADLRSLEAAAR